MSSDTKGPIEVACDALFAIGGPLDDGADMVCPMCRRAVVYCNENRGKECKGAGPIARSAYAQLHRMPLLSQDEEFLAKMAKVIFIDTSLLPVMTRVQRAAELFDREILGRNKP